MQSIPHHPISPRSILTLSTHLRLGLPSGLFPSGFPGSKTFRELYLFPPSSEIPNLFGPLERANLDYWTPPEDGNRSSSRNVLLSICLGFQTMAKIQKSSGSVYYFVFLSHIRQMPKKSYIVACCYLQNPFQLEFQVSTI
jgi:hypothetical protein